MSSLFGFLTVWHTTRAPPPAIHTAVFLRFAVVCRDPPQEVFHRGPLAVFTHMRERDRIFLFHFFNHLPNEVRAFFCTCCFLRRHSGLHDMVFFVQTARCTYRHSCFQSHSFDQVWFLFLFTFADAHCSWMAQESDARKMVTFYDYANFEKKKWYVRKDLKHFHTRKYNSSKTCPKAADETFFKVETLHIIILFQKD